MEKHVFKPDRPAPALSVGPVGWVRANLFASRWHALLTLLGLYLIWLVVPPLIEWAFIEADWVGERRADCTREGACWVFVKERFGQFMYGFYPRPERWRVNLTVLLAVVGAAPLFVGAFRHKLRYGLVFLFAYPLLAYWLLHGGFLGLSLVPTSLWGGLMLTLVIAAVGIAGALPLGILLALGRRSVLPGRAADRRAVPALGDAAAVAGRGHEAVLAAARHGRGAAVRGRVSRRGGAWRLAGRPPGTIRGCPGARTGLLAHDGPGGAAP